MLYLDDFEHGIHLWYHHQSQGTNRIHHPQKFYRLEITPPECSLGQLPQFTVTGSLQKCPHSCQQSSTVKYDRPIMVIRSLLNFSSVQSLSRVRLCNPMNHSMPGLPVHHRLPEFTQTHVHWVSDAIQPSHPLLPPSPLAPNPSHHQSFPMSQLFAWGGQSTGVSALASVLPITPRSATYCK